MAERQEERGERAKERQRDRQPVREGSVGVYVCVVEGGGVVAFKC